MPCFLVCSENHFYADCIEVILNFDTGCVQVGFSTSVQVGQKFDFENLCHADTNLGNSRADHPCQRSRWTGFARRWQVCPTPLMGNQGATAKSAAAPIHRKDTITMAIILYVNLDSNGRFLYNDVVQSLSTHNQLNSEMFIYWIRRDCPTRYRYTWSAELLHHAIGSVGRSSTNTEPDFDFSEPIT